MQLLPGRVMNIRAAGMFWGNFPFCLCILKAIANMAQPFCLPYYSARGKLVTGLSPKITLVMRK
ncbi:MAG: hypothetical protein WC628_05355 [Candidatus Omnitrophota bacterium]